MKMTHDLDVRNLPKMKKTCFFFQQMLMHDWRLTLNLIDNDVSISREKVENILHNEIETTKVALLE